jgi:sugar lactone lactonase YvrE
VTAGSPGFLLTVNGANFVSSSVVQWNGGARATTVVSATQLQATITSADVAVGANNTVTVANPAGLGGVSAGFGLTVNNPVPAISKLSPAALAAGGPAFTLTVTGSNFVPTSVVRFHGVARPTTFVSATTLQATIPSAEIASVGLLTVTVLNPTPAGGTSGNLTFTSAFPPPSIKGLTPGSIVLGSGAFTLKITGSNFVPSSVVNFNGSPRATTFVSSTELHATINAADVAAAGVSNVTVVNTVLNVLAPLNKAANAGIDPTTSSPFTFLTGSTGGTGFAQVIINQGSRDLAYDSAQQLIYASVPSSATTNPNTISVLSLATAAITSSQSAGTNPDILAISDDGQFLYAGIDGANSIQRFTLPGLVKDINFSLGADPFFGPFFAEDLQVAPGAPHTVAVTLANAAVSPAEQGGVAVFDDATQRPTKFPGGSHLVRSLQWGADATKLFGSDLFNGLDTLSVTAGGVNLIQSFNGIANGDRIHLSAANSQVYGEGGEVLSTAGQTTASFNARGPLAIDPDLNAAFIIPQNFFGPITLQAFNLTRFTLNRTITLSGVTGTPRRMIRWGQNGLAFNTDSGQIVLVAGNFLDPITAPPALPVPTPTPTPTPNPNPQAPAITFLNPGSAIAGGSSFTLTVQGTNFTNSSVVQFNGSARATTFVSSTELQATITAADVATVGVATVTVLDPGNGPSSGSTFLIGSAGGTGFAVAAVPEPAQDIILDPARQAIYLSVPNTVPEGNSIAVLDLPSAKIVGTQFAGSNPDLLSIAENSQFLYAALDGSSSVQRFTLPFLGTDVSYSLGGDPFFGPFFALDLQVAPGAPHTTAVSLGSRGVSPQAIGGITIFDDTIARPVRAPGFPGTGDLYDSIQWGPDATTMSAANGDDTGFDFYTLSVNASGITQTHDFASTFGSFSNRIHFDRGTNLVYSNDGHVLDPITGLQAGVFKTSGTMVPDSSLNTAFFMNQGFGANTVTIQSYDLTHFTPVGSINVPVTGNARRLIRWGQNGLAFNTDSGQVFLVGGSFLAPVPTTFPAPAPLPTPAPTPAVNAPVITLLTPSSAIAGGSGFTITITGTGFDPAAVVQFNGAALTTTFNSSTQLQASVPAGSIATPGAAFVTVANPANNGGTSALSTFFIGSTGGNGFAVSAINLAANDLLFDPLHQVILLSVPSTAAAHGNTISALDPASETIISSQFAGSEPGVLALSDDSHFLYAGLNGASKVQRFTLPDLATDVSYPLGNGGFNVGANTAQDLQVAPGAPHTTAVTTAQGTVIVFDDVTPRAGTANGGNSIQWGTDATSLFSTGGFFGDLFTFSVTPAGLTRTNDFLVDIGGRIHFDRGNHLLWGENGHVVDPVAGSPVAILSAAGPTVTDSSLNVAFVLTGGFGSATLTAFDMTHFTAVGSITIPNVNGGVKRLIRWGQNGLAFNTNSGQVFLVGGNFVSPVSAATPPATPLPAPPPTPAANAPAITLLTPSSALAGANAFTLQVNGTNFDPAATVQFNGSPRTTTFISSTQLQAAISQADVASAGTSIVTVANPVNNGGTSAGSTFFIGTSAASNFAVTAISQTSNDLLFDPLRRIFLISVPGAAGAHGNAISALDLSGNVISTQFAGSEPNVLALSGDSQFLYAGIDGASRVQRFALPDVTLDVHYRLGDSFFGLPTAADLQVAPGAPHTSAVLTSGFNPSGKLTVFDDATPRANVFTNAGPFQWGTDASTLFSVGSFSDDLLSLLVDANGITLNHDFPSFLTGRRLHFDATTGHIYGDNGAVLDPATGQAVATFKSSGLMVVDAKLNAAYFLEQPFNGSAVIDAFDLTHFVKTGSITIPGVSGTAGRLVRWGENGLAFNTSDGHIFLVGGNFVSPISTTIPPATLLPTPPAPVVPGPTTPIISSLSPGSAATGGADVVLIVKGTNFTASSVVQFNGTALITTFNSAIQLSATIPAAAIASGGAAQVVVVDPNGTSNPSSFFVGATAGTGTGGTSFAFTNVAQSSNNLIFDPVHQVFFISVPSTAANLGNTVTALDLSGHAISSQFAGSDPNVLGISNDGQFLYAGINGAGRAQRFSLPSFAPDLNYSLGNPNQFGPPTAIDFQVAPNSSHTVAYATGTLTPFFFTDGVVVFDDATPRTNRAFTQPSSLQWQDASTLLGSDGFSSGLLVMGVDANGVTTLHDFFSFVFSTHIRFSPATGFVYGNDGRVVDPATGIVLGSYAVGTPSTTNLMIPDSGLGKAFFLTQTQNAGNTTVTLQSFNLITFAPLNSMTIPNLKGTVQCLVRWGTNGLAFNTNQGQIVVLGGSFVN